jgi:cytochrome subunit of sulfide dehydrogenase
MIRSAVTRQGHRKALRQLPAAFEKKEKGVSMNQGKIIRGLVLALAASPALAQTAAAPPAGRLLASNCFQCHGTNGSGGVENIRGESVNEIYGELKEMQRKSTPKMMDMHARGYTDAEIKLLANYLATLR